MTARRFPDDFAIDPVLSGDEYLLSSTGKILMQDVLDKAASVPNDNIDGGQASTNYGGTIPINGGTA